MKKILALFIAVVAISCTNAQQKTTFSKEKIKHIVIQWVKYKVKNGKNIFALNKKLA